MQELRIITAYQTHPFQSGQGGGVRYVQNLIKQLAAACSAIKFYGVGGEQETQDSVEYVPVIKYHTGYIRFLFTLMLKLLREDLSTYSLVHVHRLYFAIPFMIFAPHLKIVCSLHGRTFLFLNLSMEVFF